MRKINYRDIKNCRIITLILVICIVILSGWTPKESIWGTLNNEPLHNNNLHLYVSGEFMVLKDDAIVPSISTHDYSTNEYRRPGIKGNGNINRQQKAMHLLIRLINSVFSMPFLCSFYINFIGEREQKLLIIKYIHNKDGLKSISINPLNFINKKKEEVNYEYRIMDIGYCWRSNRSSV